MAETKPLIFQGLFLFWHLRFGKLKQPQANEFDGHHDGMVIGVR
ncbi:hypothetical protein [Duganella flavida]|nr:hypothetical protein [Duganella flavida]